ncbi:protein of unknown function DUF164 [Candidatus Magnetoovum chiemensis]|nr:protein of unknown function DUF164 [Candidatus Magnetoovum chiemensis]
MLKELNQLKEIQQLDKEIIKSQKIIDNTPSNIHEYEKPFIEAKNAYEQKKLEYEKELKTKKEIEANLSEVIEKIKKQKDRAKDVKTNKEYQSHLKEIQTTEKIKSKIEDNILDVMEVIDKLSKEVKILQEKHKKEDEKLNEKRTELKAQQEEAQKSLDVLIKKRNQIASKIDKALYDKYMDLFERKNMLAVVRVENEICQGCNMKVMPQLYVEVMKNEKLMNCPQCGRLLYYEPQEARQLGNELIDVSLYEDMLNDIYKVLSQISDFKELETREVDPAHKVPFAGGPQSATTFWVLACAKKVNCVSIVVEDKVSQGRGFGDTIQKWLNNEEDGGTEGKKKRLKELRSILKLENKPIDQIPYRLLNRTVAAVKEAIQYNAKYAIMIVYSSEYYYEYNQFVSLFVEETDEISRDKIISIGQKGGVSVYLAWVRGDSKYLE